jgi:hypothetical protein
MTDETHVQYVGLSTAEKDSNFDMCEDFENNCLPESKTCFYFILNFQSKICTGIYLY